MTGLPQEVQDLVGLWLFHGGIVFLRVAAIMAILPAFGERSVPARVKLVLALAFTLIVSPAVEPFAAPPNMASIIGFIFSETAVGVALGLGIRLFILALQTAGSIAAQSTSLAQILGGAAVEPIPAMGYVLVVAGLALAVMSGLHVHAARLMIYSYQMFPAGELPGGQALAQWGTAHLARAFTLAFTLAAPFVIASMLYNLTLGVINRAMPQLMVAFVGAPVITFGGLFILAIAAPLMVSIWRDALIGFLANPLELPR